MFESQEVFDGKVSGANRGGLIVHVGRVRGFVPASQVASVRLSRNADDAEREKALGELVGRTIPVKVIELDRRRNRLILSERAALRERRQKQKERLLSELKEGDVRRGVVSSLCDFGAFVDLGGADGLVHISELSWSRVTHPSQVLKVGDEVDVYVLGVDVQRRRIALSIKRLKPEPWSEVEERYHIGQIVRGHITNITEFGAFARLDEDIEGLIHISELSEQHINHPSEVVHEGQELDLRVIRIDAAKQRLGLSLRRVTEEQYEDFDWEAAENLEGAESLAEGEDDQ
ncbi:MAG: S1 RNA-binding domain-containing protein [Chloroflexi bacterium]|nr:S1 RNA-binding domain-containing protein [Chloroflexota bacterium]